jgi:hypothetical protein
VCVPNATVSRRDAVLAFACQLFSAGGGGTAESLKAIKDGNIGPKSRDERLTIRVEAAPREGVADEEDSGGLGKFVSSEALSDRSAEPGNLGGPFVPLVLISTLPIPTSI